MDSSFCDSRFSRGAREVLDTREEEAVMDGMIGAEQPGAPACDEPIGAEEARGRLGR
jgi:hypothetical protein